MEEIKNEFFTGSICLSDIPREMIKKADNGKMYLNISVGNYKDKATGVAKLDNYGNKFWISCAPKKDERKDDVNYFIGKLKEWQDTQSVKPVTPADIDAMSSVTAEDNLPF